MKDDFTAVVMAAGQGKRMAPLSVKKPKPMIEVASKPIIEHLISQINLAGIKKFVLIVGYCEEAIKRHFGDGSRFGCRIEYVTQTEMLGTGHAVMQAEHMVNDSFIVINADMFVSADDINAFINTPGCILTVQAVEDISRYGSVQIKDGYVADIREKDPDSPSKMASIGMYKFNRSIFDALHSIPKSSRGEYELPTAIQKLIDDKKEAFSVFVCNSWRDVSYPYDLISFNKYVSERLSFHSYGCIDDSVRISGKVSLDDNSCIKNGCIIDGILTVGHNTIIEENCSFSGAVSLGNNCIVKAGSRIDNSIIMDSTQIGYRTFVSDSVIGSSCSLGCGNIIASRSSDGKLHGCIIGDDSKLEDNVIVRSGSVLNIGTELPRDSVYPVL
jgi:bifunctional UDP-N-acetylglucosamine pyrophosphorylase/glucosamine-1-phosphate N-acetyltransferase